MHNQEALTHKLTRIVLCGHHKNEKEKKTNALRANNNFSRGNTQKGQTHLHR